MFFLPSIRIKDFQNIFTTISHHEIIDTKCTITWNKEIFILKRTQNNIILFYCKDYWRCTCYLITLRFWDAVHQFDTHSSSKRSKAQSFVRSAITASFYFSRGLKDKKAKMIIFMLLFLHKELIAFFCIQISITSCFLKPLSYSMSHSHFLLSVFSIYVSFL